MSSLSMPPLHACFVAKVCPLTTSFVAECGKGSPGQGKRTEEEGAEQNRGQESGWRHPTGLGLESGDAGAAAWLPQQTVVSGFSSLTALVAREGLLSGLLLLGALAGAARLGVEAGEIRLKSREPLLGQTGVEHCLHLL